MVPSPRIFAAFFAFGLFALGPVAAALAERDEFEDLSDQVSILVVGREVVAVDALSGRPISERLEIEEPVTATHALGLIGVAVTPRRLLGFSARTRQWNEARLRLNDSAPGDGHFSRKLALYFTDQQIFVFDGIRGRWATLNLPPGEAVADLGLGRNVAAVVTDRRAIAYSTSRGRFVTEGLFPRRARARLRVSDNAATVFDSDRLLTFGAQGSRWVASSTIGFD